jgi:hypothetical protein
MIVKSVWKHTSKAVAVSCFLALLGAMVIMFEGSSQPIFGPILILAGMSAMLVGCVLMFLGEMFDDV